MAAFSRKPKEPAPSDELELLRLQLDQVRKRIIDLETDHDKARADVERLAGTLAEAALAGEPADGVALAGSRERLAALEGVLVAARSAATATEKRIAGVQEQRRRQALADLCDERASRVGEALAALLSVGQEVASAVAATGAFAAPQIGAGIQRMVGDLATQLQRDVIQSERYRARDLRLPVAAKSEPPPAAALAEALPNTSFVPGRQYLRAAAYRAEKGLPA